MVARGFLGLLLVSSLLQSSRASTNATSSQRRELYDYIARTFPQVCPYEPLCYQQARKTATGTEGSCCLPCSCRGHCRLLGNCCPDKLLETEESTGGNELPAGVFKCTIAMVGYHTRTRIAKYYNMINSCPPRPPLTSMPNLSMDCERTGKLGPSTLIPVTDIETGITYKNVHCSKCHGVSGGLQWSASFLCKMNTLLSTMEGEFSSIAGLLENPGRCTVLFSPPKEIFVESDRCFPTPGGICNQTNIWKPDGPPERTIEACENWGAVHSKYGNVYCSICNGMPVRRTESCDSSFTLTPIEYSFTATLNYLSGAPENNRNAETSNNDVCQMGFIMDPHLKTCRRIICPQLKRLVNGQCENIVTNFDNIKLFLVLKLATDDVQYFEKELVNSSKGTAHDYLKFLTTGRQDFNISVDHVAMTAADFPGPPYLTVIGVILIRTVTGPDILQWIYDRLSLTFTYTSPAGQEFVFNASLNAKIYIRFLNYNGMYRRTLKSMTGALTDLAANSTLVSLYHNKLEGGGFVGVFLSRLLFCRQVRLNQSEYEDYGLSIVLLVSNITLYTFELMKNSNTSEVRVCVEDYLAGAPNVRVDDHSPGFRPGLVYSLGLVIALCLVAGALAGAIYRHRRLARLPPSSS